MTVERRLVLAFAVAMALLLAMGAAAWRSMQAAHAHAEQVQVQREALAGLAEVLLAITEAESGARGFVIGGDEAFLETYQRARQRAHERLEALRMLEAQGLDRAALERLTGLVARRLDLVDGLVATRRAQGAVAAGALVAGAEGKHVQDEARGTVAQLQAAVLAAIEPAERLAERAQSLAEGVVVASALAALVLGSLALRRSRDDLAAQGAAAAAIREREQALRQAQEQLQRVFDHSLDALCTVDAEGRFVQVSAAAERLWGWRPEELIGTPYIEKVLEDDRPRTLDEAASIMSGRPALAFENRYRHRDGRVVHVMWSAQWLQQDALMFCVGRDVTDRHDLVAELQRRNDALQVQAGAMRDATSRAEAADRVKSAFLATMSHELRTPLNSIIGFTGVLLQRLAGPLNDEQVRQLEMVRGSGRHLLALVNDVLDISKIEAGQLEVACAAYDLNEVLQRVLASVRPLAEAKGLALEVDTEPALVPALARAVGDERRVSQVLLNLLGNAVKFTDKGKVGLRLRTVPGPTARVSMAVEDTGIGIAPEHLPHLFQPFRQIDSRLQRLHEGTGLGLAISQRLAQLMGGRIEAAGRPGDGSCFTFELPLRGAAGDGDATTASAAADGTASPSAAAS